MEKLGAVGRGGAVGTLGAVGRGGTVGGVGVVGRFDAAGILGAPIPSLLVLRRTSGPRVVVLPGGAGRCGLPL